MKIRNIIIIFAFFSVFFLISSCSRQQSLDDLRNDSTPITYVLEKRIGEIRSLGDIPSSHGANYVLRQNDGTNILLIIDFDSFNFERYSGKQVEVTGELTIAFDKSRIMKVRDIDMIDIEISIKDKVPLLLSYNGRMTGIVFKFPDNYKISDGASEIILSSYNDTNNDFIEENTLIDNSDKIIVSKILTSFEQTLPEFLGYSNIDNIDFSELGYQKSKIGEEGYEALKKEDSANRTQEYYVKRGVNVFRFSYLSKDFETFYQSQIDFYNILQTVKFPAIEVPSIQDSSQEFDLNYAANPLIIEGDIESDSTQGNLNTSISETQ